MRRRILVACLAVMFRSHFNVFDMRARAAISNLNVRHYVEPGRSVSLSEEAGLELELKNMRDEAPGMQREC